MSRQGLELTLERIFRTIGCVSGLALLPNRDLFGNYSAAPGTYDELYASDGELRPAWRRFAEASAEVSLEEFVRRWSQAKRLLEQNSLAYPDPNDPKAIAHPWALDVFPLVITAEDWRLVEEALSQRACLLNLILRDLCGPQELLQDEVLPAEIVFGHPGFQLAFCENDSRKQAGLHLYAADLARSPNGGWWVLADRCEAPSGVGFALENRIAISRIFPEVIHQCPVQQLAPYFIAVQKQLASLAPEGVLEPRVVLLSQKAGSVNYFEDAFLARYLGYTLAEAGDLTVRDEVVHLKTLAGLSCVDVILRRLNSEHCDPLELLDSSSFGVTGLTQSVRSGKVSMANGLGSGLVESPIFMAFMPQLSMRLLGEPLKIPGVATWWCGDDESRHYVFSCLDDLVVKPAFRRRGGPANETLWLSQLTRNELIQVIESNPGKYVAQERVVRSSMPAWLEGHVVQTFMALRAFAVANHDGFKVMPGGLARVSTSLTPLELSLMDGERTRDTWVLADEPVQKVSLLPPDDGGGELRRGGVDLPSRAAEHFFWLGRLGIRAECLGRLLRAISLRITSEEETSRIPEFPVLLHVLAERGQIEPGFVVDEIKTQLPDIEQQLPALVLRDDQPGTLRSMISRLVSLAATVRDLMSVDSWRILRQMDVDSWVASDQPTVLEMLERVEETLVLLTAFSGQIAESMTRTHAWRFLDLGRRIERGLETAALIRSVVGGQGAADHSFLSVLLEISESLMTYRSRYFSRVRLAPTLDLLIVDESNPHAMIFQLLELENHISELPADLKVLEGQGDLRALGMSLVHLVRSTDIQEIAQDFASGNRGPLNRRLDAILSDLPALADEIALRYFFHSGKTKQLDEIAPL